MFVQPAKGRAVRDPVKHTLLPDNGANVPDSAFWLRRVRDGDVIKIESPAKKGANK